jgi:hypothetical protein
VMSPLGISTSRITASRFTENSPLSSTSIQYHN